MRNRMEFERGFTLIELITVIVVLGILAAIVAPQYFDMADQAKQEADSHALSEAVVQFNLAYMKYVVENKQPPADLSAMSSSDFLDVDGSGRRVVGDYRFTFTQSGSSVTVSSERTTQAGGWDTPVTRTIDWP